MTPTQAWFLFGVALSVAVLSVSLALLRGPLQHVLEDLLGSATRARFFAIAFFALLATSTLAGSLLPPDSIAGDAVARDSMHMNTARQLLAASLALLVGLGASGGLLLILIVNYESRRT